MSTPVDHPSSRTSLVYAEWFFPAFFPYLLVLIKWLALLLAEQKIFPNGYVDIPFATFTFDLWAIITKLQGRPLRPGVPTTPAQNTREGVFVVVALVAHLIIYLFSVLVLLRQSSPLGYMFGGLAMGVGALIPCYLLGWPGDRSDAGGP